mgnify:CR=1 FL=1
MDVRLLAYRKVIIDTGISTSSLIPSGSTSTSYCIQAYITEFGGAVPCDIFSVGTEIYNSTEELIGTVTCCEDCEVVCPEYAYSYRIQINRVANNGALAFGENFKVGRMKTFTLDLQDNPTIPLNFQFTDTKEPEKRKASYSQTFKIPFTDNNNAFFESWYNLNIETLNYNTRMEVPVVLYQGAAEQFEGVLQLKSVYLKKGLYEVNLISNSANLFSNVGNKSVREAFNYTANNWKFKYNYTNLGYSWDGSTDLFENTSGVSFRDTDANVQRVMLPMSVNLPGFIYPEPGVSDGHMRMDAGSIESILEPGNGGPDFDFTYFTVPIHQFKPAIQLRSVVKQIIYNAGFTYLSNFFNSDYFGKIFMTTCNHTGLPHAEVVPTPGMVDGQAIVGWAFDPSWTFPSNGWASQSLSSTANFSCPDGGSSYQTMIFNQYVPMNSGDDWPQNVTGTFYGGNAFRRTDYNMTAIRVTSMVRLENFIGCNNSSTCQIIYRVRCRPQPTGAFDDTKTWWSGYINKEMTGGPGYWNVPFSDTLSLEQVPVNWYARVEVRVANISKYDNSLNARIYWGNQDMFGIEYMRSKLEVVWTGFFGNVYGKTVDTIAGIDPSLKQKDLLQDIIKRFNLVIVPDRSNPTRLFIEPYDTFMASGEVRNWTDKLDTSKEITIKDTLSMQKASVELSDAEDEDLKNKSIKEFLPSLNVYGNYKMQNSNNQFARGEQTYKSIFSPYINTEVFSNNSGAPTAIPRMVVQYETSYDRVDPSTFVDIPSPVTKPKLFYYSGKKTNAFEDATQQYWLHELNPPEGIGTSGLIAHGFTDYPLCTPFELEVEDEAEGVLSATTKSLYWDVVPPDLAGTPMFTYPGYQPVIKESLFYTYWARFNNRIYNPNTKIVECFLNLSPVDIFQFNFNDEIFIKDQYYQILEIKNYQVGAKASTKVKMMTIMDESAEVCLDCDFVIGTVYDDSIPGNTWGNRYVWCPAADASCTPSLDSDTQASIDGTYLIGLQTSRECCECNGGMFVEVDPAYEGGGFTPYSQWQVGNGYCIPNANSLPIDLSQIYRARNFMKEGNTKRYIQGILGGYEKSLSTGTNRDKYSYNILPEFGDDIKIQYSSKFSSNLAPITGESHRLVLLGKTTGTTKGYAYINGFYYSEPLYIPYNSIVNIRVKGISTVIGGTSTTYPIGSTEAFAYYTAFKNEGDDTHTVTQLGTANGTSEYDLLESGKASTCTLEIDSGDDTSIRFGIKDADADAIRLWQLTVDYDVNIVQNMAEGIGINFAEYQNSERISFQDETELIWN